MARSFILLFVFFACSPYPRKTTTNLYKAVLRQELENAEVFLSKGANVNYREDNRGWTPLLFSAELGDYTMAKLLIENGADVNMESLKYEVTPLHRAASNGFFEIVKLLVESGAALNEQETYLRATPLMYAAGNGHPEVAEYLLQHDALINVRGNRGESALYLAVSTEQVETVKILLQYGANSTRPDIYGKTCLEKAEELKNEEIINLLKNVQN